MRLNELRKMILEAIKEYGHQPAPSKPVPRREPGIKEPPTKPEKPTRRRPLTPPKEAPKTRPKAEGLSENEKAILKKITNRFNNLK